MQATLLSPASPVASLPAARPKSALQRRLLICGVLSSIYYVFMNLTVPLWWDGYSMTSQVVSELSAIDAPTRTLWVRMGVVYTLLVTLFGIGVILAARGSRAIRAVGILLVADGLISATWPPMHMRGEAMTLTDTLHIVWSGAWLLTMLIAMILAARALGRRFRIYTFATLAVFLVFGALTTMGGTQLAANQPTPWIGLWERINIAAAMAWISVLAAALLRRARR